MTMFGKVLVYLNLVMSLLFLGWAVGIFTQRVDWSPRYTVFTHEPIADRPGQIEEVQKEINSLVAQRDVMERHWQTEMPLLPKQEKLQADYQDWYKDQLAMMETGKNLAGKEIELPVRVLKPDKDESFIRDDNSRDPEKHLDQPMKHLRYYEDEYQAKVKQVQAEQAEIDRLVKLVLAKTYEKNGKPGETRGVQGQLDDQRAYYQLHKDEMDYLKPLLDHAETDRELLENRRVALAKLKKELTSPPRLTSRP